MFNFWTRRATRAGLLSLAALGLVACTEDNRRPVASTANLQQACDTSFVVVNQSSLTVAQLFFGSSARTTWDADMLGSNVLPPGRQVPYRARNPGNYDFRVVWQNGRAAELRGVNICRASQIIVTNNGLRAS